MSVYVILCCSGQRRDSALQSIPAKKSRGMCTGNFLFQAHTFPRERLPYLNYIIQETRGHVLGRYHSAEMLDSARRKSYSNPTMAWTLTQAFGLRPFSCASRDDNYSVSLCYWSVLCAAAVAIVLPAFFCVLLLLSLNLLAKNPIYRI